MPYTVAALTAAFLWALGGLFSATSAKHLGTFGYNRWRMAVSTLILGLLATFSGGWQALDMEALVPLVLSGFIGIFIGDAALFTCMNRMGPRRAGLLFACQSVFAALLGFAIHGERLAGLKLVGFLCVFAGVFMAILLGRKKVQQHKWEVIHGSIAIAIGLGLIAALAQAVGSLIAKPVMQMNQVDPFSAAFVRTLTALIANFVLLGLMPRQVKTQNRITWKIFALTSFGGFISMGIGMSLVLYALQEGDVGLVSLLSSTTPIMLLPMLWIYTKQAPNRPAWIGAGLAVLGTGLIVI